MQFYTDPERESDPNALPDAEVFTVTADDCEPGTVFWNDDDDEPFSPGFYWWSCLPGCLPYSDPIGPFDTEQEAIDDARERSAY